MADSLRDIAIPAPATFITSGSPTRPAPTGSPARPTSADASLEERCEKVRAEIKTWERDHLAKTGRKVTREDVKANPSIVAKYEAYENIRAKISGKRQPHKLPKSKLTSKPPKRKRDEQQYIPSTPSKRTTSQNFSTPSKHASIPETQALENTPQTPKPLMLGPTPQKNGILISLFENLPDSSSTPTPRKALTNLSNLSNMPNLPNQPHSTTNVPATPSRSTGRVILPVTPSTGDGAGKRFGGRTPMSSGRRFLLDQFVTPRKRKAEEEGDGTPSSIAKRFATPAFFRQYMVPTAIESVVETQEEEEVVRRVPRKPLLKTLSVMIREIREGKEKEVKRVEREEEDRLDEELEMLREVEGGGEPVVKRVRKVVETDVEAEERIDRDGFLEVDGQREMSELLPVEEEKGSEKKEGVFRRLWKKKGQKRTTKRVIMRPTKSIATTSATEEPAEDDEDDEDEFNAEYDKVDDDEDDEPFQLTATKRPATDPAKEKEKPKRKTADRNNYRRLKIKQKNPKGNGRFGRRR